MALPMTAALRRSCGSPLVRRALLLSGLAAGLWLAGSAGSSAAADKLPAQPLAPIAAPVQDLAGRLLSPVTSAVPPVVAPAVEATVTPVVQALAPVGEALAPVVRAVEPVTAPVVAVLSPVISPVVKPVVAPVRPVLVPVLRPAAVVEPVMRPVAVVEPARAAIVEPVVDSPSVLDAPVLVPAGGEMAGPAAESETAAATNDADAGVVVDQSIGASVPGPAPVPGGRNVPVPGPALPSGAPAPAVASGPSSPDQHAADVPPAVTAVDLVALGAAADDARDAAADRALDPTFSPD